MHLHKTESQPCRETAEKEESRGGLKKGKKNDLRLKLEEKQGV